MEKWNNKFLPNSKAARKLIADAVFNMQYLKPIFSIFLILQFSSLFSQEIVFRTTLNKNRVVLGETFQLTFTLENADGRKFTPPSLDDFYVVGGPNQSTNMQFINGSMSRSLSFSYYLQPKKEGTFSIDPAYVEVSGRSLKSNAVSVEVVKQNAAAQSGNNQTSKPTTLEGQIAENVFVVMVLDKNEVFQGEQVTATFKLYTRMQIGNVTFSKVPAFSGFWTQDLENVQNLQFTKEVYKGVQFDVATLKKVALFPQRPGDLDIDAMELETVVRVQSKGRQRSIWDDFFATYQDVPFKMQSNKAKVKVKALPNTNKPNSFNGVVGAFNMEVKLDKTETNVDDPITLSIKISGDGNIKMIEKPMLDLPKDFDVFDPKTNESVTKRNNNVTGYKTFDFLLVPRRPGSFKVPSFSFSYFDVNKKNYVTHNSPEFTIKVTGQASTATSQQVIGIKKEEVELLGEDIRFIKSTATFQQKNNAFFGTASFTGAYVTPFILLIGLLLYKRRDDELKSNTTLLKKKQATKVAGKRLAEAKKHLQVNDKKKFYDETAKALWGYLSDKLNIPQSELSKETASAALFNKGVTVETNKRIFDVIEDCEMALFASVAGGSMDSIYSNAENIINELESVLK
jgi:hypothetical protein